jgi:hypothetical protein
VCVDGCAFISAGTLGAALGRRIPPPSHEIGLDHTGCSRSRRAVSMFLLIRCPMRQAIRIAASGSLAPLKSVAASDHPCICCIPAVGRAGSALPSSSPYT